ncbi:hypothetical protein IAT38_002848 [Cryptococcus sp. DSM 104549]
MAARPSTAHIARRLHQLTLSSPPATALFYARLWHALLPPHPANDPAPPPPEHDHESLHALALAFLQADEPYSAVHLVRDRSGLDDAVVEMDAHRVQPGVRTGHSTPCYGCAVIVAKCCDKLGRFTEGQMVLSRALKRCTPTNLSLPSPASNAASAFLLLASLSTKGKAPETAVENYRKALDEDPWLWEAFTGLCDIGVPPPVEALFPSPPTVSISRAPSMRSSRPPISPNPLRQKSPAEPAPNVLRLQMAAPPQTNGGGGGGLFTPDVGGGAGGKLGMLGNMGSWDTPSMTADSTFSHTNEQPSKRPFPTFMSTASSFLRGAASASTPVPHALNDSPPKLPNMKRARGKDAVKRPAPIAETPQAQMSGGYQGMPLGRELRGNGVGNEGRFLDTDDMPVRRSSRLKTSSSKPVVQKTRDVREIRSTRSRSVTSSNSAATADIPSPPSQPSQDAVLQAAADEYLRDIVRKCARAYRSLAMFQCQQVVKDLEALPYEVKSSAWALDLLGRAFYEVANYVAAGRAFAHLRVLEPYRLPSMDLYSTLLWHLSDGPSLSHLSQSLMSVNRESPEPWIAAGNCFSLQKDQDEAMRCFRRATQVDPGCAYAWTLCGYEAVEMEEYERAMAFYRTAIRTEARHYNAWYGIGLVYLKTGKYKYAEHHFRRAAEINPTNPVLLCCVGEALEKNDDPVQAIHFYERAARLAPTSPMVQFKRIRALVALHRYDDAISALEPLSHDAPDEAQIFFLLGKCYLKKERRVDAARAFTVARELMPKLEGAIKEALEAGGEEEDEDEEEEGGRVQL